MLTLYFVSSRIVYRALSKFIPSYSHLHLYWLIDQEVSESNHQSYKIHFDIVLDLLDNCFLLSFAFIKHMFNVEYLKNNTSTCLMLNILKIILTITEKKKIYSHWSVLDYDKAWKAMMYCKHGLICPSKNSIILCNNSKWTQLLTRLRPGLKLIFETINLAATGGVL